MKRIRKGTIIKCKETIFNNFNQKLFEKDKEYGVLYVNNEDIKIMVCIDHKIYDEYMEFSIEWVTNNFKIL